ncbi:MAG: DNA-3-methyladenine glycosylase [Ponticaulis sp.]|nr:DNA-3-methyladenine glycosylase [Ponticaulis sp.]
MSPFTQEHLKHTCEVLSAADPALARAYQDIGVPEWRSATPSYQTLARTLVYQLISTRAAAAIWERLLAFGNGEITPTIIRSATETELRECGLSGPKINFLNSVADAIETGTLDLASLAHLDDETARKHLLSVKGIGPWTANVYLMGALHRMNVFPETDVGLIEAFRVLSNSESRLSPRAFRDHARSWQPYRSMAAHLLWGHLNWRRARTD